ncbi:hypothetical protein HYPSUDRAFT_288107 [Hypholoma sublateritium FD-334 SS-4]|uniref:Uncharacterized protein n=1 Tax=Hypholoma sublateritium (strain FD-334 SS-4) TaxID=945553 RepID=A0A0D2P8G8_HYPSF|nr:hypothetical protein HYPSUDRAFT_288107 [Hypholoma sublateritium FD-334 SS-4]
MKTVLAIANSVSLKPGYISAFTGTAADSAHIPMIPAFLQCFINLWIFLGWISSLSSTRALPRPKRGNVASGEARTSLCCGCADPSSQNTSDDVVAGCGTYHMAQNSVDEMDLACECSVHESAFDQQQCCVQNGYDNSCEGSIKRTVGVQVFDESLIMGSLSSLQSTNDVESRDRNTADELLLFNSSKSTSECSKNEWAQEKDLAWNNTMLALRACMVASESENILALRPEENQRLSRAHRISQQNELRAIQEWRSDLGETREKPPRPAVVNAKYRLISNFQFPLSPTVSQETWGS